MVRLRRRFHTHGHAIPIVNTNQQMSPNVHAGFDTALPTFRTSKGFSRPTSSS